VEQEVSKTELNVEIDKANSSDMSFCGLSPKGDVAFVVHKPLGEHPARREVKR